MPEQMLNAAYKAKTLNKIIKATTNWRKRAIYNQSTTIKTRDRHSTLPKYMMEQKLSESSPKDHEGR